MGAPRPARRGPGPHRRAGRRTEPLMFRLYKQQRSIMSFEDYGHIVRFAREIGATSALEFGPGVSTLALVEAGVRRIATCEYQAKFLVQARQKLARYPQVRLYGFRNSSPAVVDGLPPGRFDVAFVDSPVGQGENAVTVPGLDGLSRYHTMAFALTRSPVALLHDAHRPGETATLDRLRSEGFAVEMLPSAKGIAVVRHA
jgi:hypothetical protein